MGSFRRWCYNHGLRWHAQNLTRDSGGPERAMWRAGRCWVNVFTGNGETGEGYREILEINPEWYVRPQARLGASLTVGDGDGDADIGLSLQTPLGSLYLTIDPQSRGWAHWIERYLPGYWFDRSTYRNVAGPGPNRMKHTEPAEIRLEWDRDSIRWSVWHSTHSWSSKTPRWRQGHLDLVDILLGRPQYTKVSVGEPVRALASLPEGDYPLLLQRQTQTWKRPRWPVPTVRHSVDIKAGPDAGGDAPGFRGKGEHSWDLDDDAILGMSSNGHSFEDAVGAYVSATLKNRRKYGHIKPEHQAVFAGVGHEE